MLNSLKLKESIMQLLSDNSQDYFANNIGVLTGSKMQFDEAKLAERKQEIATILTQLGIDENPYTSLSSLTTYKDGQQWNELQTFEDFQALELLLACSEACGFVHNGACVVQRNMNAIGTLNSVIISNCGRTIVGDDKKWTKIVREQIASHLVFDTEPEYIAECAVAVPTR